MKRTHAERDAARRMATERVIAESEAQRAVLAVLAAEGKQPTKKKATKKKAVSDV